jgi:hypothetical protein
MATGMLNEHQITGVWEHMLAAETRALYFGDLATSYTRRKQWITGGSFFLQSGVVAALVAQAPAWVPLALAVVGTAASAYAMAVNLDGQVATMARLYAAWHAIALQYEQLWSHVWADDAEDQFHRILDRERDPSELAVSAAPHDAPRLSKWEDRVLALHHVNTPA